jgi:DNA polymerase bacteriophage-type
VLIDADSAQIEARVLAWLAEQEDVVATFAANGDVYKRMASQIFGVPVEEVATEQRQVGKVVVLGAGYGVGHHKLQLFLKMQAGIEVDLGEAKRIIERPSVSSTSAVRTTRSGRANWSRAASLQRTCGFVG